MRERPAWLPTGYSLECNTDDFVVLYRDGPSRPAKVAVFSYHGVGKEGILNAIRKYETSLVREPLLV